RQPLGAVRRRQRRGTPGRVAPATAAGALQLQHVAGLEGEAVDLALQPPPVRPAGIEDEARRPPGPAARGAPGRRLRRRLLQVAAEDAAPAEELVVATDAEAAARLPRPAAAGDQLGALDAEGREAL